MDIKNIESHEVIKAFARRGWALYDTGPRGPVEVNFTEEVLEAIVSMGPALSYLEEGNVYTILPLSDDPFDFTRVKKLVNVVAQAGRAPFYVDLAMGADGQPEMTGRYLIDSVIYEPGSLRLIIEPRLSNSNVDWSGHKNPSILLDLPEDLWRIGGPCSCLMMAMRGIK